MGRGRERRPVFSEKAFRAEGTKLAEDGDAPASGGGKPFSHPNSDKQRGAL